MTGPRLLLRIKRDCSGSAIVEFAMVAPLLFAMVFGILQVGIQMWSYNSLRSIAAETARYTMVEYQKQSAPTTDDIASKAIAIAVNQPYSFNIDRLDYPDVQAPASDIAGMTKFTISLSYTPTSILDFVGIEAPTMTITRPIYVKT